MDIETADRLISSGMDMVHVRLWGGPYMHCFTRYNREFTDKCHFIPSWKWLGEKRCFRVHYLDLALLESKAFEAGYAVHYEDAALNQIKCLKLEYLGRRELKKWPLEVIDVKPPFKFRDYQIIGAQFMYVTSRVLNSDGMGGGKTAQAIGAVLLNKMYGKPYRTLVVCPASVKFDAWQRQFATMTDLRVVVLDSNMDKRQYQYLQESEKNADVFIVGYEGFISDYEDLAQQFKPDIIILDEVQRMCNRTNKITQVLIGGKVVHKPFPTLCCPHSIYLLSGTPISNDLEDLYALLRLIDPGLFDWIGFSNRYTIMEERSRWARSMDGKPYQRKYWELVSYKHEDELKKIKLGLHMIRRTKDEMLPELPPKTFQVLDIELGKEERSIYNALKKDFAAEVRGKELTVDTVLSWMTRAQQICNSLESLPDSTAKKSTKLEELIRIVNEQAKVRKIVIFSKYHVMTSIICRELAHLNPLHLHGGISSDVWTRPNGSPTNDRQELIDAFQTDPKYRVFVSTLGAGGVGVTLTAADLVIMYDRWWSPVLNMQAVDRLHRIGQVNPVLVVIMRVKDSVEEYIERTWLQKQELIADAIGDEAVLQRLTAQELGTLI